MIAYKGRPSLKQYLPLKPIKRGIKAWVCADSVSGYMCDFNIYEGKDDIQGKGLGYKVVTSLCEELYDKNYWFFFDNFCVGFPHTLSGATIFLSLFICIREPSVVTWSLAVRERSLGMRKLYAFRQKNYHRFVSPLSFCFILVKCSWLV